MSHHCCLFNELIHLHKNLLSLDLSKRLFVSRYFLLDNNLPLFPLNCGHVTVLPAKMIIHFTETLYHKSSKSREETKAAKSFTVSLKSVTPTFWCPSFSGESFKRNSLYSYPLPFRRIVLDDAWELNLMFIKDNKLFCQSETN